MLTLISMTDLPRDILIPILVKNAPSTACIRVFQQVSKEFYQIVNDPYFQYALLVKLKGKNFTGDIFKSTPRKYLRLDRDMTRTFRFITRKKNFSSEVLSRTLNDSSSIKLTDLNSRRFMVTDERSNYTSFTFSESVVDNLKKVDDANPEEWQKCMKHIVSCMIEEGCSTEISELAHCTIC